MNVKWLKVVIVLGFLPTIFSCSEFLDCSACVKHKCTMIETRKTVQCVSNPRVPGVKLKVTSLDRCDLFIERRTLPTVNTTPTSTPMVFSPFEQTTQPNLYFTPSTRPFHSTTTQTPIPLNRNSLMFPNVETKANRLQFHLNIPSPSPMTTTTSTTYRPDPPVSPTHKSDLNIREFPAAVNRTYFRTTTTTVPTTSAPAKRTTSAQKLMQIPVIQSTVTLPFKEQSVVTTSTLKATSNVLSLPERTVTSSSPSPLEVIKTTQLILFSSPPPPPPVNSNNSIMISIKTDAFDDSLSSSFKMFKNMRRDYFHKQCTDNINFNMMKRFYRHKHFTITQDQVNAKIEKCVNMMLRNN